MEELSILHGPSTFLHSKVPTKARVREARIQVGLIVNALQKYESDYGRLPCSTEAMSAAVGGTEDFTYGGTFQTPGGAMLEVAGPSAVSSKYKASNAEIMAILLDLEKYPNNLPASVLTECTAILGAIRSSSPSI